MSGQDFEQLTLFREDSPASRSAQPGSVEAVKMTVTSGQRCCELSKKSGPLGLLERTLLESSTWRSTQCFLTWKVKATKQGRLYFQLAASAPHIGGTGAPLWLGTMTASQTGGSHSIRSPKRRKGRAPSPAEVAVLWPTPTAQMGKGPSFSKSRQGGPNLQTAVSMLPTPTAFDAKGLDRMPRKDATLTRSILLSQKVAMLEPEGKGTLNPEWVESMMGFPLGWTALDQNGQTGPGKLESHE